MYSSPIRAQGIMKKIGIVGGITWRAAAEYYLEICHRAEEKRLVGKLPGPPSTPEMAIESLDAAKAVSLLGKGDVERCWRGFDEYYQAALQRLEAGGAEAAVLTCNTAHHRFEEIVRGVRMPVISILDAAAQEGVRIGARQMLILGSALTMRSARVQGAFAKHGIELAGPRSESARAATIALIEKLERGRVKGAMTRLGRIARLSWPFAGEPVVCLAHPELAMAFPVSRMKPSFKYGGVTYVSTMAAHINALLEFVGIEQEQKTGPALASGPA